MFVIEGDITTFKISAVVSNDDVDGRMWTAVASAIKAVAGSEIERESIAGGPYPLGTAWFTSSGDLQAADVGIIHVAAVDRQGGSNRLETIKQCVKAALQEAVDRKLRSVALAAIGTPAISMPEWIASIPYEIVMQLERNPTTELAVLLVLLEPDDFADLTERARVSVSRAVSDSSHAAPGAL